jgi:hypothetical protein
MPFVTESQPSGGEVGHTHQCDTRKQSALLIVLRYIGGEVTATHVLTRVAPIVVPWLSEPTAKSGGLFSVR